MVTSYLNYRGKAIMLIPGCSHQSYCVNVVSRRHIPPTSSPPPSLVKSMCVLILEKGIDDILITPGAVARAVPYS